MCCRQGVCMLYLNIFLKGCFFPPFNPPRLVNASYLCRSPLASQFAFEALGAVLLDHRGHCYTMPGYMLPSSTNGVRLGA